MISWAKTGSSEYVAASIIPEDLRYTISSWDCRISVGPVTSIERRYRRGLAQFTVHLTSFGALQRVPRLVVRRSCAGAAVVIRGT